MICNNDNLRSIHFAYFHSIASYGTIFWGNSSYSRKIFTLKKKIIRIMMGAHPRTSCRKLLKKLEILTVPSQFIYSLMSFFKIGNQDKFLTNSPVHSINTIYRALLLICLVFKRAHPTLGSEFLTTYHKALQALGMKSHSLK